MSAYIGSELKGTNPVSIDINEYFSVASIPANENIKITTVGTASRIQIPADNILSGQTIILTVKKTFPTNFIQILLGVLNTQPGGDNPNTCKIKIDDQIETYSSFAHPQIGSPLISNLTPIFLAPKTNIIITLLKDLNDGVTRLIGLTGYDNNGIAHDISKAYIGVPTEKTKDVPRQETTTKTISCTVNDANTASQYKKLSDLFTITNGSSYYFANTNTESTNNYSTYKSNNGGQDSTTASTTLTALHDFSALSFGYSYSSESGYDYVTLTVGGTTIESKASGSTTNKTWNGTLSKGQTINITYTKDGSANNGDDCGTIYNIQATYQATVTETVIDKVGTGEYANLARKVKKIYLGDENNKAQLVFGRPNYVLVSYTPTKNLSGFSIKGLSEKPSALMIFTAITGNNGSIYNNSGCWSYTNYSANQCSGYYLKNGTAYHITTPPTITINDYVNITSLGKVTINNVETEVESPAGIKVYAALIYNKTGNDIYYGSSLSTDDVTRYSFYVNLPKIGNNYDYAAPFGFVIPPTVAMFLDFTNHKVLYNNGSSSNNHWYIGSIDTMTEAQKYTEYKVNLSRNSQSRLTTPSAANIILLSHESQKEVTY